MLECLSALLGIWTPTFRLTAQRSNQTVVYKNLKSTKQAELTQDDRPRISLPETIKANEMNKYS